MWVLFVLLALMAAVQAQGFGYGGYGSSIVESQCLQRVNTTMDQISPVLNLITDPSDQEGIGPFLTCLWQGNQILGMYGKINTKKIVQYISEKYSGLLMSSKQLEAVKRESKQCKSLKDMQLTGLAIKIKNCILTIISNTGFLPPLSQNTNQYNNFGGQYNNPVGQYGNPGGQYGNAAGQYGDMGGKNTKTDSA